MTVYFIANASETKIKIGYTQHSGEDRMRHFVTGSPDQLHLVYEMPGSMSYEQELHRRFDHANDHHEWFHYTDDIRQFIAECRDGESILLKRQQEDLERRIRERKREERNLLKLIERGRSAHKLRESSRQQEVESLYQNVADSHPKPRRLLPAAPSHSNKDAVYCLIGVVTCVALVAGYLGVVWLVAFVRRFMQVAYTYVIDNNETVLLYSFVAVVAMIILGVIAMIGYYAHLDDKKQAGLRGRSEE